MARRKDVEIAAVADSVPVRRRPGSQGSCLVRESMRTPNSYLAREGQPGLIDIATPPLRPRKIAQAAFDAGLHVLCEKPMATSVEEDLRPARGGPVRSKRVLFPCPQLQACPGCHGYQRYHPLWAAIGKVRAVTLETFRKHAVPRGCSSGTRIGGARSATRVVGIAMDHGSHSLYLTFDWMSAFPSSGDGRKWPIQTPDRWDTEDNFFAVLTFPTGDWRHAHLTWTAGGTQGNVHGAG